MLGVKTHSGGDKTTGSGVIYDSLDHTKKNEPEIKLELDMARMRRKRPRQNNRRTTRRERRNPGAAKTNVGAHAKKQRLCSDCGACAGFS